MTGQRLRAALGMAIVAVGLALGCKAERGQPDAKSAGVEGARTPSLEPGERATYQATLNSQVDLPGGDGRRVDVDLAGELELTARRAADGSLQVQAMFPHITLKTTDAQTQKDLEQVRAALERPVMLRYSEGRLEDVRVPDGYPPFATNLHRTLGAALQFAPRQGTAASWEVDETDTTGKYHARYSLGPAPGTYQKVKLAYDARPLAPASAAMPAFDVTPKVENATCSIGVADGRFRSVRCDEKLSLALGSGAPIASATTVALNRLGGTEATPAPDFDALWAHTKSTSANLIDPRPTERLPLDQDRIAGLTFEQALAALEEQERDPEKDKVWGSVNGKPIDQDELENREERVTERTDAFAAMVALLRLRPETVPKAIAAIDRRSVASGRLLSALSSAGTPQAQAALVTIVEDPRRRDQDRLTAASRLIRTASASEPTVNALIGLLDDPLLSTHATYGLGTISRRLRGAGNTQRADAIGERLTERLKAAKGTEPIVRALRGIANSGYPPALTSVRPLLSSEDTTIRGAALEALRNMDDPSIDGVLAEHLGSERSADVRLAALNAFKTRRASDVLARALATAAEHADDARVRRAAVHLSGAWAAERPELWAVLERIRTHDANDMVRAAALAELSKHSTG